MSRRNGADGARLNGGLSRYAELIAAHGSAIALVDTLVSAAEADASLRVSSWFLSGTAVLVGLVALVDLVLILPLSIWLESKGFRWGRRFGPAICVFSFACFAVVRGYGSFGEIVFSGADSERFAYYAIPAVVALVALEFGIRRFGRGRWRGRAEVLVAASAITLPFGLASAAICVWTVNYGTVGPVTLPWMAAASAGVWATASLIWALVQSPRFRGAGAALILAIPFALGYALPSRGLEGAAVPEDAPEHVILIVVDTLRYDAISAHGIGPNRTPNLDRLAADSVLFSNAVSSGPWTIPSMASILTGLPPEAHGATREEMALPDACETIGELAQRHGYYTGAIGTNPILLPSLTDFQQGFRHVSWYPNVGRDRRTFGLRMYRWLTGAHAEGNATELTDEAIDWHRENRDRSTLLWLHYFDVHLPYEPPTAYLPQYATPRSYMPGAIEMGIAALGMGIGDARKAAIETLYRAEVSYVDAEIGRLMDALREEGLYDEALIVFTSDHGEEFWEHGGFEHGHTLYRELTHVPYFVKLPGQDAAGEVHELVPTMSIPSTVAALCGMEMAPHVESRGAIHSRAHGGDGPARGTPVASGATKGGRNLTGITTGRWKFISEVDGTSEELYDLVADPGERSNVATVYPDIASEMRGTLSKQKEESDALARQLGIRSAKVDDLDPELADRLRGLGYLH